MQLRWVAIDDEPPALDLLKSYAAKMPVLKMINVFDDAVAGAEFIRNNAVDLLFLDINMPDINGLDVLKSLDVKPLTIFTTAYKKFAFEGFELDAVDYLLKPFEFERFSKAISKALEKHEQKKAPKQQESDAIYVRSEYQLVKIELDSIEYIESLEDYLKINLVAGKPLMTLMTLKAIIEKLPPEKFMRIHRSYIVPVAKIKSLNNRKVKLSTTELPVSDTYIEDLKKRLHG